MHKPDTFKSERHCALDATYPKRYNKVPRHRVPVWPVGLALLLCVAAVLTVLSTPLLP